MKRCSKCKQELPLDQFHNATRRKDGKQSYCKTCRVEITKASHAKWYAENTDRAKARVKKWKKANAERVTAGRRDQSRRRRATVTDAISDDTDWTIPFVFSIYRACLKCGSTEDLQLDHIEPLSLGGSHTLGNFQVLCGHCNQSKGNRESTDYRKRAKFALGIQSSKMVLEGNNRLPQ